MYRYELHAHTADCDPAARLNAEELVKAYKDRGYCGMVITDHYCTWFLETWLGEELAGADHAQRMNRWLRGYRRAREAGEKLGFTVLLGAEVRVEGNINDYLVYGLTEEDLFRLPMLCKLQRIEEVLDVLPEHTCVVHAHPFRNGMTVQDPSRLFGIEVYNARTDAFRNGLAREFAAHYGKAMLSGSDTHGEITDHMGGIATDVPITTSAQLVSILRSGNYRLIQPE